MRLALVKSVVVAKRHAVTTDWQIERSVRRPYVDALWDLVECIAGAYLRKFPLLVCASDRLKKALTPRFNHCTRT